MMIKYAIIMAVVLALAAVFAWAFLPARHLPGNRARYLRIRLHLRLHPGQGFTHLFSLWLRWSRLAMLRSAGRIRPALPLHYRLLDPGPGRAGRARRPARRRGPPPLLRAAHRLHPSGLERVDREPG